MIIMLPVASVGYRSLSRPLRSLSFSATNGRNESVNGRRPEMLLEKPSAKSSRRIGTAKISRIDGNSRPTEDDTTLIERRD